jgi:DNA-binding LacI/PurR family transcriptional regulator
MTVTLKTIGKKTGLSISTVSHILSGRPGRYSTHTREHVRAAAQSLGYRPNSFARALVTGKTRRIAYWSPVMASDFFQKVFCHFNDLLCREGYDLIQGEFGPQYRSGTGRPGAFGFTRADIDGLLTYHGGTGVFDEAALNHPDFPPYVNMGLICTGRSDYVSIDLFDAAVKAVRHILSKNRKHIVYVLTPHTSFPQENRFRAYTRVMEEQSRTPQFLIVEGTGDKASVRRAIKEYVENGQCPDGIFCANDEMAMGVYRGLRDLGVEIPRDVTLVGCDGIEHLEYFDTPISTIRQPYEDMCATAWTFLKNRMENNQIPQQKTVLKAEFLKRE